MKKPSRNQHQHSARPVRAHIEDLYTDLSAGGRKYHDLSPEQWQWAVSMIREFELNPDGARILIEEIKKGNFVFE